MQNHTTLQQDGPHANAENRTTTINGLHIMFELVPRMTTNARAGEMKTCSMKKHEHFFMRTRHAHMTFESIQIT